MVRFLSRAATAVVLAVLGALLALVSAAPADGQSTPAVVISEIFYNPDGADEDHEFVKIINAGDTAVELSGWSFDAGISFTFPDGTELGSYDTFVIAATQTGFAAAFNTNPDGVFQSSLSNKGETLRLVDAQQVTVDQVTYDDIAPWPRSPDGDGDSLQLADLDADNADPRWWTAGPPSPTGANSPHLAVVFDVTRGFYSGNQTVTLTATDPAATIEYALDNGALAETYTGPITVVDNDDIAVIRARAVKGDQASVITSHTYVFLADTGAAVAAIWANGLARADTDTETGHLEIVMPPSVGLPSVAEHAGFAVSSGGVSAESTKVYFRGAYGAGTFRADLFGDFYYGAEPTKQFDQLVFRNQHQDATLMRHAVAMDTLSEMGSLSPNGRFVRFYHGGEYMHARFLQERPEGGFMETYHGGTKQDYIAGNGKDDDIVFGIIPERNTVPYEPYAESIVLPQFYDVSINTWFINNSDVAYNWRWAQYQGPAPSIDGRMFFFNWDADVGYGDGSRSPMEGWGSQAFGSVGFRWRAPSTRIRQYSLYRKTPAVYGMGDRFQCHLMTPGGALDPEVVLDRIDARYEQLLNAGGPERSRLRPNQLEDWKTLMDTWVPGRAEWLIDATRADSTFPETDAVTGSVVDNKMVLSGPLGWPIYYTLDGSDPRRSDTTPNPAAILYTEPVALPSGQSHVVARAYNADKALDVDKWTPACLEQPLALSSTDVGPQNSLVINEIHYNPTPDGAEFIEIVNVGDAAVSLAGMALAQGISADLPTTMLESGGFLVLADSATAFETAYGFAAHGTFSGELSNSGETIDLVGADGAILDTVSYRDSEPWPNASDGTGPSLSVLDSEAARTANDIAASWGSSADKGGTPNAANTITDLPVPKVSGLTLAAAADAATVTWSISDSAQVTGYRVELLGPGAPDDVVEVAGGDSTSLIVENLAAATGYCARVQAVSGDQVSERSRWSCIDDAVSTGDVDCDGGIDTDDIVSSLQVLVELRFGMVGCPLDDPSTEANSEAGDLDGDGEADLTDAWRQARCAAAANPVNTAEFCPTE